MEEARNAMYVPPGPTAADKQAKKAERKAQREARKSEADAEILALVAASEAKDIEIEKLKVAVQKLKKGPRAPREGQQKDNAARSPSPGAQADPEGVLGQRTIAKPPGEHTVSYNIDTYLNMSEKAWAKVSGIAADAMSHANIPRAKYTYAYLKKNKSANLKTAAMLIDRKVKAFRRCVDFWPAREVIKMKIRSAREYDRSKEGRKERRDAEKERKRRGEMAEAEQQEQ